MPQHPLTSDETARLGDAVPAEPEAPRPEAPAPAAAPAPVTAEPVVPAPAPEPAEPAATADATPEPLSDDTRPVPRDRGPVTVEPPAPAAATPPAPTPAAPDWDATADIRFAPGEGLGRPGAVPPAEPAEDAAPEGLLGDDGLRDPGSEDSGSAAVRSGDDHPGGHGPGDDGPRDPGGPPAPGAAPRRPWWRRPAVLAPAAAVVVLGGAYTADLLVAGDDVPRNTVIAGLDVGGLSPAEAAERLDGELAPRVAADHTVVAGDLTAPFSPAAAGIALDVDATVDAAAGQPLNPWTRLVSVFAEREVEPVISGDDTALTAQVDAIAAQVDRAPVDATIAVEGTSAALVEPQVGRELDRDGAAAAITAALASGGDPGEPIELPVDEADVRVDAEEAQRVLDEVVTPGLAAPITVSSADGSTSVEIPVEALAASLAFTPQDDGTLGVAIDPALLAEAMGDEFGEFGTPAQDARFELVGGQVQVVPSVDGTGIDPAALAAQLVDVLPSAAPRSVTAALGPIPADLTTDEAAALGIREEISSFTTTTTSGASGTNIRVVAEEVDGALVLPGETFSLNTYTGPRGTAQGYVPANVISGGQLSTAVGGGISQFATTMFNAVFFAGLEDVYHKPHSFYISRYPAGREATVYEGQIDLQWRNDSDSGVFVDTSWAPAASGGSVTVTFYGTKRYEIEAVEGPRTNYREPAVLQRPDDGDCIRQPGVRGFDVTVTRIFRDLQTGAEIKRETFRTSYAAEAVITCVPVPPPADPATPPAGTSPAPATGPAGRRPGGRRAA
jgi:vancomycin resistance protein YoaR